MEVQMLETPHGKWKKDAFIPELLSEASLSMPASEASGQGTPASTLWYARNKYAAKLEREPDMDKATRKAWQGLVEQLDQELDRRGA